MIKKNKIIIKYIFGKDVLDIGSGCNHSNYFLLPNQFDFMKTYCKSIIGTDIIKSKDKLIIQADMQYHNLNRKFDVVVVCDVIEHMENAGMFLKNMQRHLKTGGRIIITTPNANSLAPHIGYYLSFGGLKGHTQWYDKRTISLLLSKYFEIEKIYCYSVNRLYAHIFDLVPILNKSQIIVIARKK